MFFRKKPATADTWAAVRAELRRLRGHNLLRANVYEFEKQNLLRIPLEPRGGQPAGSELLLHLTPAPGEVWAEVLPGGERLACEKGDLPAFLARVAARVRQRPYLQTAAKTTSYRPSPPPSEAPS